MTSPTTPVNTAQGSRPATPLLDRVRFPSDLRNYDTEQLKQIADELRAELVDAVGVTGGHLGGFATPADRPIWDG